MQVGSHESVAGGLHEAWGRAVADGCEAFQVFVKSSRRWASKPLTDESVLAWERARSAACREAGREIVVMAHDSYLINLASPDPAVHERSMVAFADELERCERLGIGTLVFHPGAPRDESAAWGIAKIAASLDALLAATQGYRVRPAIENTAGQGTNVGWSFEHLAAILDAMREPERVGICFDTQHAFAAGWDLRTRGAYDATMTAFDDAVGLDKIEAFHLNDSKRELGCRVDRHERLGEGELGLDPFRWLVDDPRFADVPGVLETPGDPGAERPYASQVSLLKSLRGQAA